MKNLIRQLRRGALLLALLLSAGNGLFAATPGSPRYIFLFIGDGMGIPQLTLAGHATGKEITAGFPAIGVTTTSSLDHFITDSAAAATATLRGASLSSRWRRRSATSNARCANTSANFPRPRRTTATRTTEAPLRHREN